MTHQVQWLLHMKNTVRYRVTHSTIATACSGMPSPCDCTGLKAEFPNIYTCAAICKHA